MFRGKVSQAHIHMRKHTHKYLLQLTHFMYVALFLHPSVNTINLNPVLGLIFNSCASLHKSVYCNSLYLVCFMYVNKPSTLKDFIQLIMHLICMAAEFAFPLKGQLSPQSKQRLHCCFNLIESLIDNQCLKVINNLTLLFIMLC